jgi:hypothetical protein
MEMYSMGLLRMMYFKEMVLINIKMETYILDILKMDIEKEKALLHGLMEMSMKVSGCMVTWKDKEL